MLTVQCPNCGSFNDEHATACYMCKKELPGAAGRPRPVQEPAAARSGKTGRRNFDEAEYRRPGCITVYALLTFLSGIFGIAAALLLPTLLANNSSILLDPSNYPRGANPLDPQFLQFLQTYIMAYSIFVFLFSIVTFLVGWGLWTMRNWARVLILLTQGLSLVGGIIGLFASIAATNGSLIVCGVNALGLLLPGLVFVWFLLNRRLFR
jgi:hypothetical protein